MRCLIDSVAKSRDGAGTPLRDDLDWHVDRETEFAVRSALMAHPASTLNCAEKGAAMRDAGLSGSCATWVCRPRAASDVGPKPNGPMRDELTTALASLCAPELSRFRGWLWCGSCIIPSVSAFEEER